MHEGGRMEPTSREYFFAHSRDEIFIHLLDAQKKFFPMGRVKQSFPINIFSSNPFPDSREEWFGVRIEIPKEVMRKKYFLFGNLVPVIIWDPVVTVQSRPYPEQGLVLYTRNEGKNLEEKIRKMTGIQY